MTEAFHRQLSVGCFRLGTQSSVEDLQWSPAEPAVLASCSADRNICVWDARVGNTKPGATILGAHDADVNVISWNKLVNYLVVSGEPASCLLSLVRCLLTVVGVCCANDRRR